MTRHLSRGFVQAPGNTMVPQGACHQKNQRNRKNPTTYTNNRTIRLLRVPALGHLQVRVVHPKQAPKRQELKKKVKIQCLFVGRKKLDDWALGCVRVT